MLGPTIPSRFTGWTVFKSLLTQKGRKSGAETLHSKTSLNLAGKRDLFPSSQENTQESFLEQKRRKSESNGLLKATFLVLTGSRKGF